MNESEAGMLDAEEVHRIVRERYGEIARRGTAGPPAGCCAPPSAELAERVGYGAADVAAAPEGANLGLGCGAPLVHADLRAGELVLDLGSGAGFDAFLAAREVGDAGHVIGVDMTPEMLERARRNAAAAGYRNVEFRAGRIEALPVEDASVDAVISNCVINLVPDKARVYREVARVLRPGGRVVVSDIVLDAPLPELVARSAAALTGCVAGAALRADYLATVAAAGLDEIEVVKDVSFGETALAMVPEDLVRTAQAAGVDVPGVARSVRSITLRARKPIAGRKCLSHAGTPPQEPEEEECDMKDDNSIPRDARAVACSLTAEQLAARRAELTRDLRPKILEVTELADGFALRFGPEGTIVEELARFIVFERQCCSFFTFGLEVQGGDGPVTLRLSGPAETKEMLRDGLGVRR